MLDEKKVFNIKISKISAHLIEMAFLRNYHVFFFGPYVTNYTAQNMKFSIKDFFSKCDQIRSLTEFQMSFFHVCLTLKINFIQTSTCNAVADPTWRKLQNDLKTRYFEKFFSGKRHPCCPCWAASSLSINQN